MRQTGNGRRVLAGVLLTAGLARADGRQVLADFETNTPGDVLAKAAGADARPWRRFGAATADNVVAVDDGALAGKVSASYPLAWPGRFAATRLVADKPIDLSHAKTLSLIVKSDVKASVTKLTVQVSDGKTVYECKATQAVTDTATTLKFDLSPAAMTRVDGPPADLASVLAATTQVGIKLTSDGTKYSENVVFDDLTAE